MRRLPWLAVIPLVAATLSAAEPLRFNRDIRPILSDACFHCHGPDEKARQGGLRLDVAEHALRPAESGQIAVVPGEVAKSALLARIDSTDPDQQMPPPATQKVLTAAQKETLKRWIATGASFEQHWSFVPLGPVKVPSVQHVDWPRNEIDSFVLARLEQEGLAPSPPASNETLIRRATLDLTGLPPTIAEIDSFLADTSANAYEQVVDRLLQSPRFGERMAIDWLDAARYADSNGYQVDRDRELWPWREWVIQAFNRNLPFDQFTIEQLAGDLLPNATLDQRIATGFHRNHMLNEEGGIIEEEFLAEYTADRVETTAAVWLGQTFSCCRCHDHKYDPFTQRDFYSLKAFFHNIPERGVGIYSNPIRRNAPPFVRLPAPRMEARIRELEATQTRLTEQLASLAAATGADLEAWTGRLASTPNAWRALESLPAAADESAVRVDSETHTVEVGPRPASPPPLRLAGRFTPGRITMLRVELSSAAPANVIWKQLALQRRASPDAKPEPLRLRESEAEHSLAATEVGKVIDGARQNSLQIAVKPESPVVALWELATPLDVSDPATEFILESDLTIADAPVRWRISVTADEPENLAPTGILALAKQEPAKWTAAQRQQLLDFRLSRRSQHREWTEQLDQVKKQISAAELEIPTTLVMEEMPQARPTFVLVRGAYDKPGDAVTAGTPAVLPEFPAEFPRNRLGLAQWLVSPRNPLPARVTVNRLWQAMFGAGLVKTSEDFGAQGSPPSHPELLDWLAFEYVNRGWDTKRLLRLLLTSATYRQQSAVTPELRERDPENRLLARGGRFRLLGELVRDQALAVSGLLEERIGGPSVKPYHPPGLYEQVTAGSGYNIYVPGKGSELRRRSLYTYWKRSVPHPAMLLFDAPFRESCALRRPRTNTPLQALNLLNDPTYVEAARFLAQRMIQEGGETPASRLRYGFRLLLARPPTRSELEVLERAFHRAQTDFAAHPEDSRAFLAVGDAGQDPRLLQDLAPFTLVASSLLNLDEAITRE